MEIHKGTQPFRPGYETVGRVDYDHLLNGKKIPCLTHAVEVEPNKGILRRGSVVSLKNGKLVLCAKTLTVDSTDDDTDNPTTTTISDGSQNPYGILAEDVDTDASEKRSGQVYITGEFNKNSLTVGEGYTKDEMPALLRGLSIFITDSLSQIY